MSAQNDFALTVDIAAGLLVDVICIARSAGHGRLPAGHRRLLNRAIVGLERAQDDLFTVRNDPWQQSHSSRPPRQLDLGLL